MGVVSVVLKKAGQCNGGLCIFVGAVRWAGAVVVG